MIRGLGITAALLGLSAWAGSPNFERATVHAQAAGIYARRGDAANGEAQARLGLSAIANDDTPAAVKLRCELFALLERMKVSGADVTLGVRACAAPTTAPAGKEVIAPLAPVAAAKVLVFSSAIRDPVTQRDFWAGHFGAAAAALAKSSPGAPEIGRLSLLAAAEKELSTSPEISVALLARALDLPALNDARAEIARGELRAANARIVQLTTGSEPPVAELGSRIARALVAGVRLQAAQESFARHQLLDAYEAANEAEALDPRVGRRGELKRAVLTQRHAYLLSRARSLEARGQPVLAAAYWAGLVSLDGSEDAKKALERLTPQVINGLERTVAMEVHVARAWPEAASLEQSTRDALARQLPRFLKVANGETDYGLMISVEGPGLQTVATVGEETKRVKAYTFEQPNPAWRDAAEEYNSALDDLGSARQNYQVLMNAAQEMGRQAGSSVPGMIAAAAAMAEATAAVAVIATASEKVRATGAKLRATPKKTPTTAEEDAKYPVIDLEVESIARVGLQAADSDSHTLTREWRVSEKHNYREVPGSPKLEVPAAPAPLDQAAAVRPDVNAALKVAVSEGAAWVAARADAAAWSLVPDATTASIEDRAVGYVAYWLLGSDPARKQTAGLFLAWGLP